MHNTQSVYNSVQTPVGVATTAAAPVVSYSAYVDPTFTQNPANPLDVTYTYDAGAISTLNGVTTDLGATGQLPNGILNLYSNGVLECSTNVGGSATGGTCEVIYGGYGAQQVITTYESGSSSATETDTENIANPNPPPPVLSTVTTLGVGGGDVNDGYQFVFGVRDSQGATVTPAAGAITLVATTNDLVSINGQFSYAAWHIITETAGQSTCTLLITDTGGFLGLSSPDCSVQDPCIYLATSVTVTAAFAGTTYDTASTSTEVTYP